MDGPKDDGSGVTLAMRSAVAAVVVMEGDGAFNTGYGSMLNEDGEVEMDAGVVEGNGLRYGGVGAISEDSEAWQTESHSTRSELPFQ